MARSGMNLSGRNASRSKSSAIPNPLKARQAELLKRGLGTSTLSGDNFFLDPNKGYPYPTDKPAVDPSMEASEVFKRLSEVQSNPLPKGIYGGYEDLKKVQLDSILENARKAEEAMGGPSASFSYPSSGSSKNEIEKLITPSGPKSDELSKEKELLAQKKAAAEAFRKKEQGIAEQSGGLNSMTVADAEAASKLTPEQGAVAVENMFADSMQEYLKAMQREVPPEVNREEALDKYRKEFAEATGLDISGKPDKSQALMAMGLALMQNRAGKGFNVGKILNSVGQAGEKAMPYMTAAINEAKQAKMAAGKYALQQIKSDEDARNAIIASNESIRQELFLKNYEAKEKAKLKILEAQLEGKKPGEIAKEIYNEEIKIGTNTYKIRMGINPLNRQSVFVNAPRDADEIATAYNKTVSGLDTINKMEDLTQELINISQDATGGLTTVRFLDKAEGVLKSMGLSQGEFFEDLSKEESGGRKLSIESELDAVRRAFIMRFKRFISQETGNGISNVDVANIQAAAGQLDALTDFTNPEQAMVAFGELKELFDGSLATLQPLINDFADRRNYYEGSDGDEMYNRTMEKLTKGLNTAGNVFMATPIVTEDKLGNKVIEYDLTGG